MPFGQEAGLFCNVLFMRGRWDFPLAPLLSHDELGVRLPGQQREDAHTPPGRGRPGGMLVGRVRGVNLRELLLREPLHRGAVPELTLCLVEGRG
jgi:hypothetical protein